MVQSFFLSDRSVTLRPNIEIWCNSHRARSLVYLSEGTCRAENENQGQAYIERSRVPKGSFRLAQERELELLLRDRWGGAARSVGILDILPVDELPTEALLKSWLSSGKALDLTGEVFFREKLELRLKTKLIFETIIGYHRVSSDGNNLRSVSFDHKCGRFVGLHLDGWVGMGSKFNRLCINLGPFSRYFLFIPQPISILRQAAMAQVELFRGERDVSHAFMELFPTYPVVAIRIDPGWAYLAPTTRIIHDAASLGADGLTYHVAFRGDFRPIES